MYELARELGLSNKETVDLCNDLGIGVKSHSSSVVEAQADRVRRKAEREGLIREPEPEPEEEKPAKPSKKAVSSKKAPPKKKAAPQPAEEKAPAEPEPEAPPAAPAPPSAPAPTPAPPKPPAAPTAPAAERAEPSAPRPPAVRPTKMVRSSGKEGLPPRPRDDEPAAPSPTPREAPKPPAAAPKPPSAAPKPPSAAPSPPPAAPAAVPAAEDSADDKPAAESRPTPADPGAKPSTPAAPPRSSSGKPIPPPPRSASGKPIPPPPGAGGRGPGPSPSGPGNRPARRGAAGQVRYTPPPPGGPRPGGGGGPGGGRPGPGGGRRPPKRRGGRRRRNRDELQPIEAPSFTPKEAPVPEGEVVIERASTPQDIGPKLNRTASDVVRFLMEQGEMVTATQSLTDDMIELFAAELGAEIRLVDPGEEQEVELQKRLGVEEIIQDEEASESLPHRPPIVTIMGHVDHGKTKLLDYIREANVVAGEAGGITQHIGAYQAEKDGHLLTFIDTPGHEAFTAMRARGAEATDIVVLVVAADDGVMPQTVEAINHAKAAEVPIVVAVNKIDRETAQPEKVMQQLSEHDLIPEEWGGETIFCKVSALEGIGIDELLESLVLTAEIEDLRASPDGRAAGAVLESHLDTGRGPVATVLVQHGTLRVGDPLVAGAAWGRVRALINDHGENVKEAPPATPVQVLGLSDVADAGDQFIVAPDDKTAKDVAGKRDHFQRQASLGREAAISGGAKLEDIFSAIQAGEVATLSLILKADVNGSLEALTDSLKKLERDDVKLGFVHRAVGGITESDIQLASTSNATIIGFNVRPDRKAREMADAEGVEIRTYEIIYKVLEDIEAAMVGMLEPEYEEVVTGEAEVREIFSVPRIGKIAGCMVLDGVITRGSKVRFLREGTIIWKGAVSSLKRFKDDVTEVRAGFECGIGLTDFQDLKDGDIIETYEEREIAPT